MTEKDAKRKIMDEPVIERYRRFQIIDRKGSMTGLVCLFLTAKEVPERLVLECDNNHSNYYRIGADES
jgi:hypothetical protein